eukprot:PhM_4_TR18610/c7_g3_i3/m.83773
MGCIFPLSYFHLTFFGTFSFETFSLTVQMCNACVIAVHPANLQGETRRHLQWHHELLARNEREWWRLQCATPRLGGGQRLHFTQGSTISNWLFHTAIQQQTIVSGDRAEFLAAYAKQVNTAVEAARKWRRAESIHFLNGSVSNGRKKERKKTINKE